MEIPDVCLPWIKLQRSGYKDHKKEFVKNMEFEFEMIKPFLPKECKSILDIGCGVGGIDVLLSMHFETPELYMYDYNAKSQIVIYGFDRGQSYYNSFDVTKKFLDANYITNYFLLDVNTCKFSGLLKDIDLVISLLSWGYHYKTETYLDEVYDILKPGGHLIIDIRNYSNGVNVIKKKEFREIKRIANYNKAYRMCCIK